MTAAFGLTAGHIGTTSNCIDVAVQSYTSSGFVAAAVNDTVVFLAISYRLISISFTDTWSERLNNFFRGQHMNHVSRVLLQTGQLYYLCVLCPSTFLWNILIGLYLQPDHQHEHCFDGSHTDTICPSNYSCHVHRA